MAIGGDETVEELIGMVEKALGGKNQASPLFFLIRSTTAITNPATYNQFLKRLKYLKPNVYVKNKDILDLDTNKGEDFFSKISDIFKSSKQKTLESLNQNNLGIMASLILQAEAAARIKGGGIYVFSNQTKVEECEMLKKSHDLKKRGANESLNRFRWAKDICEEKGYTKGRILMENYVDIYNLYLKEYC